MVAWISEFVFKVLSYASRGCYSWYERYGRIVMIPEDVFSVLTTSWQSWW
jgi:hypothetical protein